MSDILKKTVQSDMLLAHNFIHSIAHFYSTHTVIKIEVGSLSVIFPMYLISILGKVIRTLD